jgi:hypothetical protein
MHEFILHRLAVILGIIDKYMSHNFLSIDEKYLFHIFDRGKKNSKFLNA